MSMRRNDFRKISERIHILKADIENATFTPDRATSMVITKLDEAGMWLDKVTIQ